MPESAGLHIGLDLTALMPEATGTDVYLLNLARALLAVGTPHRFTIFGNAEDRERLADLAPCASRVLLSRRPRVLRFLGQQALIPLVARARGVDLVHSMSFIAPVIRGRAAQVVTVFDMTSFSRPGMHIALRGSAAYRALVSRSVVRADRVLVPSLHTKASVVDFLRAVDPDRIEITPLGIDSAFHAVSASERARVLSRLGICEPYILAVGTIEPRKNLPRLIEAYRRMIERTGSEASLVVAGRFGWGIEETRSAAGAESSPGSVHLLGYVADQDLPAVYSGARAFAYPSLEEGFGLPPLEAMACGAPVLSSRNSAMIETLDGAALLVDPLSVEAIADGLAELVLSDEARERWRAAGHARAGRFTWAETARRTLKAYSGAAASAAGRAA